MAANTSTPTKTGERQSNFELLRILAMLFISIGHIIGHCIIPTIGRPEVLILTTKEFFYSLFWLLCQMGVQIFVLITGYFMVKSQVRWKSFFKIIFETLFYSYLFLIIFSIFFPSHVNKATLHPSTYPIAYGQYWFITTYLILYIFIPYINIAINNISKREHQKWILILFTLYFILKTVGLNYNFSYLGVFVTLYLVGSYIRLYGVSFIENKRNCILIIVGYFLLVSGWFELCMHVFHKRNLINELSFSYSPLLLFASCAMLCLFKNLKIKYNKIINFIAISSLSVYLITSNIFIRDTFWNRYLNLEKMCTTLTTIPLAFYVLFIAISSFIICILFDKLRIQLFEKPLFALFEKMKSFVLQKINK